jgi:carbon-monoxide dehydrogenase small subunit
MSQQTIDFTLNGVPTRVSVPVQMSALEMIRNVAGLTGTKYGCGEGECGACTILLDGVSLNSCLLFAVECDGRQVTTIEGLAADPVGLRIEKAFVEAGAVQCGFCTPGMVMQARQLLEQNPHPSREEDPARHRGQPVPLHRLREDRRRHRGGAARSKPCPKPSRKIP